MNEFYILSEPEGNPDIPEYWSYSQLEEWRTCPKRWWLLKAKYPHIKGKYPIPYTFPMMQGIILHKTIEYFGHCVKNTANYDLALSSFNLRNTIHIVLKELLESQNSSNPRFNKAYLKSRFCIDDCINNFKRIISQMGKDFFSKGDHLHDPLDTPILQLPLKGHEVTIYVEQPRISGRIDFIDDGKIVEYKSGFPDPSNDRQLDFYGLLYWLKTGKVPISLELVYSNTKLTAFKKITVNDLKRLNNEITEEIRNIEECIHLGLPETTIREGQCGYCPCRQNCDNYWKHLSKENYVIENKNKSGPSWVDIEIIKLPESWQGFGSCIGIGKSQQLDEVYLNIESSKCPDILSNKCPIGARILGAQLSYENNNWYLKTAILTEVFWIY